MKKIKMIFTNPLKGFKLILIHLVTIIFIGLTLYLLLTHKETWIISNIIYGITTLLLTYCIYTLILIIPKMKSTIINWLEKRTFVRKVLRNYKFRTIFFAVFAFITTIILAIFQAIMGIIESSLWFGALAFYYLVLSLMRGNNLFKIHRKKVGDDVKTKLYRNNGYMLILLTFIFFIAVAQMVFQAKGFEHIGIMIYVLAIYTFYKVTLGIINIFKARKHNDFYIQTIRNINLADALVSVVALQTAMFHSFAEVNTKTNIFNGITGGVVCILIITLGIAMIIKVNNQKKYNKEDIIYDR